MKTAKCEVKKSVLSAAVFAAMAVLALAPVAQAATVTDTITGPQNYNYANSSGQAYNQYVFDGSGAELEFGSTSTYPALTNGNGFLLGDLNMQTNGELLWEAGGQPANTLYVYGNTVQTGLGTLTVSTAPFPGSSSENYLNLNIGGDQSLGATGLTFDGAGKIGFGDSATGIGDTQTLDTLTLGDNNAGNSSGNNDFSGIISLYDATLDINSVVNTSPNLLKFTSGSVVNGGGTNNVTIGSIQSTSPVSLGSGAGSSVVYNIGDVSAPVLTVGSGGSVTTTQKQTGSPPSSSTNATGGTTLNMPSGTTINLAGGAGAVIFDAAGVNLENVTIDGSAALYGGNLYIWDVGNGLNVSGNFTQQSATGGNGTVSTGGNLYIPISPTQVWGLTIGGTYQITAGNLIVEGEPGSYANGAKYTLISSGQSGGNTFSPGNVYYVYNGTQGSGIDGLNPYLTTTASKVNLCLGSSCVPTTQPAPTPTPTPTPAPAPAPAPAKVTPVTTPTTAPAKVTPVTQPVAQPAPAPAPVKIIPVKVVTPVQETQQTVADAPHMTIQQARDTQDALISTGIVGGGPRGWWAKGMGGTQSIGADHGVNYGIIAGYGFSVGPDNRDVAGVAFSAGQSGLGTGPDNFTRASDYALWAYGTYYPNASRDWKFSGAIGGGMSQNTLDSTALGLPQIANFGGSFAGAEVRASYWKQLDGITVSPRLSLGYDQSWTNGFSTNGGSFMDVQVANQSSGQFYVEPAVLIGKKFNYRTASGDHTLFPQVRVGMVENIGPTPSASVSSGQVAGQVQGLSYPHLQGMAELRLDVTSHTRYSKGLSGNISVRQLFGGGASQTEAVAAIKYRW